MTATVLIIEDEILQDFPDLTREDIRAGLAFAADREPGWPAVRREPAIRPKSVALVVSSAGRSFPWCAPCARNRTS